MNTTQIYRSKNLPRNQCEWRSSHPSERKCISVKTRVKYCPSSGGLILGNASCWQLRWMGPFSRRFSWLKYFCISCQRSWAFFSNGVTCANACHVGLRFHILCSQKSQQGSKVTAFCQSTTSGLPKYLLREPLDFAWGWTWCATNVRKSVLHHTNESMPTKTPRSKLSWNCWATSIIRSYEDKFCWTELIFLGLFHCS